MEKYTSLIRSAAEQLVADLRRGEQLTHNWSDEPLSDTLVDAAISSCLARLRETDCWGEANRLPSSILWNIAGPLLETGWLQLRARSKPLGYAGDYQMLARICDECCCDHPLGRAFDRFFLDQAAPRAVRSRNEYTAASLVSHCLSSSRDNYHLVSVGSGPTMDVRDALRLLPEDRRSHVRVTLMDIDPGGLDFAREQLSPLLPMDQITCRRENLFRLVDRSTTLPRGSVDFLICAGLLDYLTDEAATALLAWLHQRLSRSGRLLVGNFARHNPTRAYMEWIGNWYLTYRTAEQMDALARETGMEQSQYTVGAERLGVILLLTANQSARGLRPSG